MTLGRKRSKEKVGVNGEIRSGWGEGHGEGSQKREMSLAERLASLRCMFHECTGFIKHGAPCSVPSTQKNCLAHA